MTTNTAHQHNTEAQEAEAQATASPASEAAQTETTDGQTETTTENTAAIALVAEIQEWKDKALRATAELENSRRMHQKEINDARTYAISKFALEMLGVADNMHRAQAALPQNPAGEIKVLADGVEMVIKQFEQCFEKFNITRFESVGQPINPDRHQVMQQQPSDEVPADHVLQEMQAGYLINDRLLRPALVIASTGPANSEDTNTTTTQGETSA